MSQDGTRTLPIKGVHVNKNANSKAIDVTMGNNRNDPKMQTATNFSMDVIGNPSYTIKEGGTLKRKI